MNAINIRWSYPNLTFVGFNAAAALFVCCFVIWPLGAHFGDRARTIDEKADQLQRMTSMSAAATAIAAQSQNAEDAFLRSADDRIASADLQAHMKRTVIESGGRFLSVKSLPGGNVRQLRTVNAVVEFEGSISSISHLLQGLDSMKPSIFVTALSIRRPDSNAEPDSLLRGELRGFAALRPNAQRQENPSSLGDLRP